VSEFKDEYYNELPLQAEIRLSNAQANSSSLEEQYSDKEKENSDPVAQSVYSGRERSVGSRCSLRKSSEQHSVDNRLGKRPCYKKAANSLKSFLQKTHLAELREETVPDREEESLYKHTLNEKRSSSFLARCFGDYEPQAEQPIPIDLDYPCIAYVFNENTYKIGYEDLQKHQETPDLIYLSPNRTRDNQAPPLPSLLSDHNSYQSCAHDPFRMNEDNAVSPS
jgi:hypothetical protein